MGKFKIWLKTTCPFCEDAQNLLAQRGIPHEVIVVDRQPVVLREVQAKYDWHTVPVILEEKESVEVFIGGYADLVQYLERSQL